MNSIRFLSRGAMLAGLIVVLVACATAQSPQKRPVLHAPAIIDV
jgi:hypothetical protein